MILTFDQLPDYRGRVAMVDGAFDPLHRGHIEYFRAAAEQLERAAAVQRRLGSLRADQAPRRCCPRTQRAAIVDAIRYIAYTHINQFDTETILRQLRPRYYVKGSDWRGRGLPPEQVGICREHGIEIVYLDTVLDSSSRLLKALLAQQYRSQR